METDNNPNTLVTVEANPNLQHHEKRAIVVNVGNLLQALALLFMVSGALVTSYIVLQGDVNAVRGELGLKLQEHSTRINSLEKTTDQDRQEQRDFQREMRTKIDGIAETLSNIKVTIGNGRR